ncbi:hypothetical protein V1525DRAFT_405394 [Lipomyces kononenkoae]|uniref:Uncharacterized protein n=1 Tax=Lipomyces kononenkoae TaxID=34357 RepID=A0ACC3SZ62_LIPKO
MLATTMPSNMLDPFRTDRRLSSGRSRPASTATYVSSNCSNDKAVARAAVAKRVSTKKTRKLPSSKTTTSASPTQVPASVNSSASTTRFPSPVSSPSPTSSVDSLDPSLLDVRSSHQPGDVSHNKVRAFFSSFASRLGPLFSLGPSTSRKSRRPASRKKQSDSVTHREASMGFNDHVRPKLSAPECWPPTPDIDEHFLNVSDATGSSVANIRMVPQLEVAIPRVPRVVLDINMSLTDERTLENDSHFVPSNAPLGIPDPVQERDHGVDYVHISHDFPRPDYSDQLLFILSQPSCMEPVDHSAVDLGDQHDLVTALQDQNQRQDLHRQPEYQMQPRPNSSLPYSWKQQHRHARLLLRKQSRANLRKEMDLQDKQPGRKRSHEDFALDDDQITLTDAQDQELRRAASAEMLSSARGWHSRYPTSVQTLTPRASDETLIDDSAVEASSSLPHPIMHKPSTTSPSLSLSAASEPLGTSPNTRLAASEYLTHPEGTIGGGPSSIQSQAEQLAPSVRSMYNDSFAMRQAVLAGPTIGEAAASINATKPHTPITPPTKASKPGAVFINLTEEDKEKINKAVAPSGSSRGSSSKFRRKSQDIIKKEKGDRQT